MPLDNPLPGNQHKTEVLNLMIERIQHYASYYWEYAKDVAFVAWSNMDLGAGLPMHVLPVVAATLVFAPLSYLVVMAFKPQKGFGYKQNSYDDLVKRNEDAGIILELEDLSALWMQQRRKIMYEKLRSSNDIGIEDLSFLWRTPFQGDNQQFIPKFKYDRSQQFFNDHIAGKEIFNSCATQRSACIRILQILEENGEEPSVVDLYRSEDTKNKDSDSQRDEKNFALLRKISLLDHSINVCEQAVEVLTRKEAEHVIPDCFIACLGHDLGKLPEAHNAFYNTHDHAASAGKVLVKVEELAKLPRRKDIMRAIKIHHRESKDLLSEVVQEADVMAREIEANLIIEEQYQKAKVVNTEPVYVDPTLSQSSASVPAVSLVDSLMTSVNNNQNTEDEEPDVTPMLSEEQTLQTQGEPHKEDEDSETADKQEASKQAAKDDKGKDEAEVKGEGATKIKINPSKARKRAAKKEDKITSDNNLSSEKEQGQASEEVASKSIENDEANKKLKPKPPARTEKTKEQKSPPKQNNTQASAGEIPLESTQEVEQDDKSTQTTQKPEQSKTASALKPKPKPKPVPEEKGCTDPVLNSSAKEETPAEKSNEELIFQAQQIALAQKRRKRDKQEIVSQAGTTVAISSAFEKVGGSTDLQDEQKQRGYLDISEWFDSEDFLTRIGKSINTYDGGVFHAFSTSDGRVFFDQIALEKAVREQMEQSGISTVDKDKKYLRKCIISIIAHYLEHHDDVVDSRYIQPGYCGNRFEVHQTGRNHPQRMYLAPFLHDRFKGLTQMENEKPSSIKRITKVELCLEKVSVNESSE